MQEGYKIRIYPSPEQELKLNVQFGHARFVYNASLAFKKFEYDKDKTSVSKNDLIKRILELKEKCLWLKDADSQVLQQKLLDLHRAFVNFFEHRAKYPKFKSKRSKQSIRYPQRVKIDKKESLIYLPKVGWIKSKFHRGFPEKYTSVSISKTSSGKYYASFLVGEKEETQDISLETIEKIIGIDLGLTDLLITSNGKKFPNKRCFKRSQSNLRKKQKSLSRKQKTSKNRKKAKSLVAKVHNKVANQRNDHNHKVSKKLADENQAVGMETLRVKNMVKNRCLSKAIHDVGWGDLTRKIEYKLKKKGGILVKIDQWFASSKTCSVCGHRLSELSLDVREWECPECHSVHDRDINAAINIQNEAIRLLLADGYAATACGVLRKTSVVEAAA